MLTLLLISPTDTLSRSKTAEKRQKEVLSLTRLAVQAAQGKEDPGLFDVLHPPPHKEGAQCKTNWLSKTRLHPSCSWKPRDGPC